MRNLQEQVKKHSFTKNCPIDLKIGPQPRISKVFREQFFLTADQNNFGNKIPFLHSAKNISFPNLVQIVQT